MANDGYKVKIGEDIPSRSGKHADPNMEEENHDEGTRDQNLREKDVGQEGDALKKAGRDEYYNESNLQNNIMQPPFPLRDTPISVAKNDAQKGGQKAIPAVPQHDKVKEHLHRLSRNVG
ncbi:hypothetical protein ACSBR1_019802 [Camellia fascicularis]